MSDISNTFANDFKSTLVETLNKAGVFYRIFARAKSGDSTFSKLSRKKEKYINKNEKMQDIVGLRIVFYFVEDVEIFHQYLKSLDNIYVSESNSMEEMNEQQRRETFAPTRLNIILRMTDEQTSRLEEELMSFTSTDGRPIDSTLIDNTYEVQLRTVFSEGWHEVEHDLRYKCKDENWWSYCQQESRLLNGLYASLETTEHAMEYIFDKIAYSNYKNKDWDAMIRNHFRIRMPLGMLSDRLSKILTDDKKTAKSILRFERNKLQERLFRFEETYPITKNNIVYLVNRLSAKNKDIIAQEPSVVKNKLDRLCKI